MSTKRNALGKGLSALLENYETDVTSTPINANKNDLRVAGSISDISLDSIEANPFQPRTKFEESALAELSNSIKKFNIIQPLTVRKLGYDKYQIISGERRYKAAKTAGLLKVPCYIRIANDQEMLEMALIENIQREQLNAIEIAISYKRLIDECSLTQEELSDRIGKNRTTVSNYLRLLKLPAEIQIAIRDGLLQMGHARALIGIDENKSQIQLFHKIIKNNLSVRQVESLVRSLRDETVETRTKSRALKPEFKRVAYQLSTHFDSKVELKEFSNKSGKIIIPFSDKDDFQRIFELLRID